MMTPVEMERRILFLEQKIQGLEAKQAQRVLPAVTQDTSSTATVLGSLPATLKTILNLGFEWIGYKVNVKAKNAGGVTVDGTGVGVKVKANSGIILDADGIWVKVRPDYGIIEDANGLYLKIRADYGLVVDSNGLYAKVRANYGLALDSNGLALKKQSAITGPVDTTQITAGAGADHVDLAGLNTQLGTLKTELDAVNDVIGNIITAIKNAEVTL
jgi:hypothetical protein